MPIYDYVCGSCGHRFEVLRGINEAGPRQCPECGGPVARAFAPPTIHFKGTGWAKSDRRASSTRARRPDTGASAAGSAGSTDSDGSRTSEGSGTPTESSGSSDSAEATTAPGTATPEKPTSSDADR